MRPIKCDKETNEGPDALAALALALAKTTPAHTLEHTQLVCDRSLRMKLGQNPDQTRHLA